MSRRRLNDHQKKRIAEQQALREQRAASRADEPGASSTDALERSGQVVVRHGRQLVVRAESGQAIPAVCRGNLGEVVCGDRVVWQATADGGGVVIALSPRRNALARSAFGGHEKPIAANLSLLVVVLAPSPEPSGFLVDQYLVAAQRIGIDGLICLNKSDLLDDDGRERFRQRFRLYEELGYPVLQVSTRAPQGLVALRERMRGETSILVGQSGVGKSSLVNVLVERDEALAGSLSTATGHGRHTTSAATLYTLVGGGALIDSPGVRSFRLGMLTQAQLELGFREFRPYLGHCRFQNCAHVAEPDCAVRAAEANGKITSVRLATYRQLLAAIE